MLAIIASSALMLDGAKVDPLDTALRVGALALVCLVLAPAHRVLSRRKLFTGLGVQLNILVVLVAGLVLLNPLLKQMNGHLRAALTAAAVLFTVVIGLKLLDVIFLERIPQLRNRPQVPLVLRDIGRWVLSVLALVLIVRSFFPDVNLNVLAVSSLVVGYIVGNATQDTLGNLFAGLALNAERPFQIGDWITAGGHTGMVVDTTWRATRLRTKAEDYVVIPNSAIGKDSIVNFSRPTRNHGCYLTIGLSYDTSPNKARQTILTVLSQVSEICQQPPPSVFLVNFGNFSLDFKIKFFIQDFARSDPIQSIVLDRLWYAFRREGISIPYPIHDERVHNAKAEEEARHQAQAETTRDSLSRVDLFQSFSPEEIQRLAGRVKLRLFAPGENLCRQGEAGDSFYVIREGRVAVYIQDGSRTPVRAATLESGAFFGEMSLLTGEPRAGTVTAETDVEVLCVSKQDFAGLLQANTNLAGRLAAALETRLAARKSIVSAAAPDRSVSDARFVLKTRILQFFGLS